MLSEPDEIEKFDVEFLTLILLLGYHRAEDDFRPWPDGFREEAERAAGALG